MKKICIYSLMLLVFMLVSIFPENIGKAYFSKKEFSKDRYIDWMYNNTRLERRRKFGKEKMIVELTKIYDRVSKERFSYIKLSLIKTESGFDNSAIGGSGERCMMQVSPSVWEKELKEKKIIVKSIKELSTDMNKCITAGSYIFDQYYAKYGSVEKAILAYNGGGDPEYKGKIVMSLGSLKMVQEELTLLNDYNEVEKNSETIE